MEEKCSFVNATESASREIDAHVDQQIASLICVLAVSQQMAPPYRNHCVSDILHLITSSLHSKY